jgi:hypothetical protein
MSADNGQTGQQEENVVTPLVELGAAALRSALLATATNPTKMMPLDVPLWGYRVYIRELTGAERDKYEGERVQIRKGGVNIDSTDTRAKLVAMGLVDADGKRVFELKDVPLITKLGAAGLDFVAEAISKLSGLKTSDADAAKN